MANFKPILNGPCADCPFRTDVAGYLTPGRVKGILQAVMLMGHTFSRDILTMLAFHDCKGIIYMGRRNDYVVLASAFDDRGYMIHAGCRKFRLRKARAHWKNKSGRAEIRRAVEEIAWLAARRVAAGSSIWRAR